MNIDEVWKQDFRSRWEPNAWIENAHTLRHAAQALFKLHSESRADDGEPLEFDHLDFDQPATLLYSYALENAIKACVIKREGIAPEAATSDDQFKTHDLVSLIQRTNISPSPQQTLLLGTASAFVQWAGKYPAAFNLEHANQLRSYLLKNQLNCAESLPPMPFGSEALVELDDLFCRLVKEIQ